MDVLSEAAATTAQVHFTRPTRSSQMPTTATTTVATKAAAGPPNESWISSGDAERPEVARIGEQSMREAPGVNGVTSQFEDLLSEVPHQCSQLDAIIVIVYYFLPGRASPHISSYQ